MDIIYLLVLIVILAVLLPIIGKIILYLIPVVVLFGIYIYFKSRKLRDEIEKDPEAYFTKQAEEREREKIYANRGDVIDAEYKEKEIIEEESE